MEVRIGQLLVEAGVLSETQVQVVLAHQQQSAVPFGLLCEQLFGVEPVRVEEAWARQYGRLTRTILPALESFDDRALQTVSRRQAWQFRVLPVRFDDGEMMTATTEQFLRRALGFATNVLCVQTYLVLADPLSLGEALCRHYPLPGMTPECVTDAGLDRLLIKGGS